MNLFDVSFIANRPIPVQTQQNQPLHSPITTFSVNLKNFLSKIPFQLFNSTTADAFLDAVVNPTNIDDRKGVFQDGLEILASLPPNSDQAIKLSHNAISTLYNTVPHPPASLLGHNFRQADGGGNSLQDPDCGRAERPFARSVQGKHPIPRSSLPEPGLVFDTILKADPLKHKDHPGGNASFTFAFASLVTHSLFRTNHKDWNQNDTSSYLDLSPLYGHNQHSQDAVRDKAQGRGLLYPDTFSEKRLLFLPPAPCALLVILNRNHNYIAETLLKINECKRWTPVPVDAAAAAKQDEEIFQTARLVNCGHFMSLILGDYAAGFLGLSEGTFWDIKAFDPITLPNGACLPRGQGNHVSVEFNMMYRWHATLSKPDIKWTEDMFDEAFHRKPYDQLDMKDFGAAMQYMEQQIAKRPSERVFGGMTRDRTTNKFPDDGLARILQGATAHPGGAYGARGTPGVLRVIEIMGIEQARSWGVCTMNEFRRFLGLREYKTFREWNPDADVADAAERLYGHIDNLELYTGLQAEQTMPVTKGSRLACGFSTTRAVLGDAIAMIRGDRFYTTDFTPGNLTAWGFQDCVRDPNNGGFGGEMPKLLMRHLPRHYPYNSVYSLFPYFTPAHMEVSLRRQGLAARYAFAPPAWKRAPKVLNTFTGIRCVFGRGKGFAGRAFGGVYVVDVGARARGPARTWGEAVFGARGGAVRIDGERALDLKGVFPAGDDVCKYNAWYRHCVTRMIERKRWNYKGIPGYHVDIVEVINMVSVTWAAEHLCGIPLKTEANPKALFTELEVYNMLKNLFSLVFLSIDDPGHEFSLRHATDEVVGIIHTLIKGAISEPKSVLSFNPLQVYTAVANTIWPCPRACREFLQRAAQLDKPKGDTVATVLGFALATSVSYAHAAVLVVDFYLDKERDKERVHLRQLIARTDPESDALLHGYVREALRLNPQCTGLFRNVTAGAEIPQGGGRPPVRVEAGDRIWASFKNALLNPEDFPDPQTVDPARPKEAYHFAGSDFQTTSGGEHVEELVAQVVRVVFGLEGVRRAPGDAGRLVGFARTAHGTETNVYIAPDGKESAFPGPMHIVYDA